MAWPVLAKKPRWLRRPPRGQRGYIGPMRAPVLRGNANIWPSFDQPLQANLSPIRSNGSATITHTSASTHYQTDFEGKQNLLPSGAARMQGARVVYNEIAGSSEDLTNGSWTLAGSATATATALIFTTSTADQITNAGHTGAVAAGTWVSRVLISVASGTKTFRLRITQTGVADHDSGDLTATTTPKIFTYSTAVSAGGTAIKFTIRQGTTASAGTLNVNQSQLENVTGQTNQNPSEYVSVGVLSAPYHGAGVDGVKYFSTLNGNTVASNVVTEATGAAINSSEAACAGGVTAGVVDASGPLGILIEGAAENLALQSQTFDVDGSGAPWADARSAGTATVSANADTAPDGTLTADRIIEDTSTGRHFISQTITLSATNHTISIYAKAGSRPRLLVWTPSAATYDKGFDLAAGVMFGPVLGSAPISASMDALPNGWYKCQLTFLGTAAAYQFRLVLDNGTTESYVGDGAGYLSLWQFDVVAASFASSPIPTTTAAITRNAEVSQGVSAGNISATALSLTMEISVPPAVALTAGTEYFHWASYVDADNYTALLSDGTNLIARKRISGANHDATIAWTRAAGTTIHAFARFDTAHGVDVGYDGTLGTPDTTTTESQIGANWQVGADGNGANQDYCEHRYFVAYTSSLSTSALMALTQ